MKFEKQKNVLGAPEKCYMYMLLAINDGVDELVNVPINVTTCQ